MHVSALGREQFEYVVSLGSVSIIYPRFIQYLDAPI